jgi:hypothetical protein
MAERVGFVRLRAFALRAPAGSHRVSDAIPPKRALKFTRARRRMAERVGFAPLLRIENKELTGFWLPHDPSDPLESLGRDTY